MREYCRNLVYLKVWDREQGSGFDEDDYNLTLCPSTSMYAGQTNDFYARERSRQDDGRTPFLLDLSMSLVLWKWPPIDIPFARTAIRSYCHGCPAV